MNKRLVSIVMVYALLLGPLQVRAQMRDFTTFQRDYSVEQEKQRGVQLLDNLRQSVKHRQQQLEDQAKKDELFYYGTRISDPENLGFVEQERQALLSIVQEWTQADKKTILAIDTHYLNQVITKSTAIGYYHGLDVVKLTKLYELGKDVIAGSLFELPENTHPDDTNTYDNLKRRYLNQQMQVNQLAKTETFSESVSRNTVQAAKNSPGIAPLMYAMEGLFNNYFDVATEREVEIAEFLAEKQEYRVLLFKRVTLAYIRTLLVSGDDLPVCNVNRSYSTTLLHGKNAPVLGCADPSLVYLRSYIDAIRTLQSAETDTFMAEAQNIIAEQQLAVDVASTLPVVGDAIDWYSLMYGIYAHEDLTGHCLTRLDYTVNFVAAALPFVGPKMLESAVARNPEVAKRFLTNMSELSDGLAYVFSTENMRRVGGDTLTSLANTAGKNLSETHSILLKSLADRWGVTPESMEQFARDVQAVVKKTERSEKNAARKAINEAKEKAAKETKARMAKIMQDTVDDAESQMRALNKLQAESPEFFEKALKEAEDIFNQSVKSIQTSQEAAIKNSNMVDEHIEVIQQYLKKQANAGSNSEKIVLIYRHVNPDSTELIRRGFFTKGMDIKGKSADWGIQRGFIPIEQKFSKLANPSKLTGNGFAADDLAKQQKFQGLVDKFFGQKTKSNDAEKFVIDLVLDDKPVMIVKDKRLNREITAYFDPSTGKFLDEAKLPLPDEALDLSNKRALQVMALTNASGEKMALTADYDLLSYGFSSEVGRPSYDDMTGFITPKQQIVLKEINEDIRNKTGYKGDVSHHGPEVQYPDSPGAFQDPLITTIDLENGVMTIPKCDQDCMRQWCSNSGLCKQYGFPTTKICDMKAPSPPCIPVDSDRLLKDYMHLRRMQRYQLFPNKNWGWGNYNPLGGWNMVGFMEAPVLPGIYDSSVRIARDFSGSIVRTQTYVQKQVYGYFISGLQYATECPLGKGESDYTEEGM